MYCHKCGKKQPNSGRFCFHCGEPLPLMETARTEHSNKTRPRHDVSGDPDLSQPHDSERSNIVAHSSDLRPQASSLEHGAARLSPHPWRRFFAHTIDVWVFGLAGSFAIGVLAYTLFPGANESLDDLFQNPLVSLVLVYVAMIPIESALLSATGTTLGKGIFGIKLRHIEGRPLTFSEALSRGVHRWARAEGLGLPIISLFAYARAYSKLKSNGATSYDESLSVAVTHTKWGPGRAIMATTATILAFLVVVMFNAIMTRL